MIGNTVPEEGVISLSIKVNQARGLQGPQVAPLNTVLLSISIYLEGSCKLSLSVFSPHLSKTMAFIILRVQSVC